jgi:hypothetical protein
MSHCVFFMLRRILSKIQFQPNKKKMKSPDNNRLLFEIVFGNYKSNYAIREGNKKKIPVRDSLSF